jgi:hypothetical protein
MGTAWADVASGDDVAHQPAECSNRGHCNTQTGQCECMPGYEGLACNRSEWRVVCLVSVLPPPAYTNS